MRHRPLLFPALAVLAGILAAGHLILPVIPILLLAGLLLVLAAGYRRRPYLGRFLLLAAMASTGAVSRSIRPLLYPAGHLELLLAKGWRPPEETVLLEGKVWRPPEKTPDGFYLYLDLNQIGAPPGKIRGRIRLKVPPGPYPGGLEMPGVGTGIRLFARLRSIRSFRNSGGYDYRSYLAHRGISLLGTVKSSLLIRRLGDGRPGWTGIIHNFRRRCEVALERMLPDEPAALGILKAILLGLRREIPERERILLQESGLYHLIAISGLHVGFLLWGWWFFLSCLRIPGRIAAAMSLPVLVILPVFYGGAGSVIRAVLMASLFFSGRFFSRRVDPWNALAFSCLVLLLFRPGEAEEVGFRLSYAATGGILLLAPGWNRRWFPRGGYLGKLLAVSLAAQAATFPMVAAEFHRISPIAIPLNLFAVPAVAILLCLGTIAIPTAMLNLAAAAPMGWMMKTICAVLTGGIEFCLGLPGATWRTPSPPDVLLIAYYGLFLSVFLLPVRIRSRMLLYGLWIAAALLVAEYRSGAKPVLGFRLTSLDVGQGDSLLLEFPGNRRILVDGGGVLGRNFDLGENVVSPALWSLHNDYFDAVALTHSHRDHAAGLMAVLRNFPTEEFWRAPGDIAVVSGPEQLARKMEVPVRDLQAGDRIWIGGSRIEILHPPPGWNAAGHPNPNERSLVLRITCGSISALLTGDIESAAERNLLHDPGSLASTLLKVAHHGSGSSSGARFLRAVRPRIGMISVGRYNPWGHPQTALVERLRQNRMSIFRTDDKGAVQFETDGCALTISTQAVGLEFHFPCDRSRKDGKFLPDLIQYPDRTGNEGQEEDAKAHPCEKDPPAAQGSHLDSHGRMTSAENEKENRP